MFYFRVKYCFEKICMKLNYYIRFHNMFSSTAINTKSPCLDCQSTAENWMCLLCNQVHCGRFIAEHMLFHHLDTEHALVLSLADFSFWCYKCEAYVDNPILFKYKNLAHIDKFGEEMKWSYDDHYNLELVQSSSSDE